MVIQWFLAATDVEIGYNWSFDRTIELPTQAWVNLDIRNRSRSKTYYVANIAYMNSARPVAAFDDKPVWGADLKPGTISRLKGAPVQGFSSLKDCLDVEVHVRLQNGRQFWLCGAGPGQQRRGTLQRAAFWLRAKLEAGSIPVE